MPQNNKKLGLVKKLASKELTKQSLWYITANIAFKFCGLLITWYAARTLSELEFGKYSLMYGALIAFQVFAVMGLEVTAAKLISSCTSEDSRVKQEKAIWVCWFIFAFITSVTLYSASELIAISFFEDSSLSSYLKVVSVIVFLFSFKTVASGIFLSKNQSKSITRANILSLLIGVPLTFFLINQYGVAGSLIGLIIIELVACASMIYAYVDFYKIAKGLLQNNIKAVIRTLKFSLPLSLSGLMVMPVNLYLLNEIAKSFTYAEVGLVNVLNQWQALLIFIPVNISTVMLPWLARIDISERRSKSRAMLSGLSLVSIIGLFSLMLFNAASNHIFEVYGENFRQNIDFSVLVSLSLCVLILIASNQINNYALSSDRVWSLFVANLTWAVSVVISFAMFSAFMGAVSSYFFARALAYLIKSILLLVMPYLNLKKKREC